MRQKKAKVQQPSTSLLARVRSAQASVFADMATLSKKHGEDVFRVAGQRYFKRQREEAALRQQIAERELELVRLRQRAQ